MIIPTGSLKTRFPGFFVSIKNSTLSYICISNEIRIHVLNAYRNKPTWRSDGIISRETAWRNTAVSNDRQSSLLVFNYHLGRIKDNLVGVVGDIAKVRATTYGRRANSRLRSIYYSAMRAFPSERGNAEIREGR